MKAIKSSPVLVLICVCDQVTPHCCPVYPYVPYLSPDLTVTASHMPRTL